MQSDHSWKNFWPQTDSGEEVEEEVEYEVDENDTEVSKDKNMILSEKHSTDNNEDDVLHHDNNIAEKRDKYFSELDEVELDDW